MNPSIALEVILRELNIQQGSGDGIFVGGQTIKETDEVSIIVKSDNDRQDNIPHNLHSKCVNLVDFREYTPKSLIGRQSSILMTRQAFMWLGSSLLDEQRKTDKDLRVQRISNIKLTVDNDRLTKNYDEGHQLFHRLSQLIFNKAPIEDKQKGFDLHGLLIYLCGGSSLIGFIWLYIYILMETWNDIDLLCTIGASMTGLTLVYFSVLGFINAVKIANIKAFIIDRRIELNAARRKENKPPAYDKIYE